MDMAGNVLVNANSLSPTKMAVWNWPALKAVWRQFLKKASILLLSGSLSVDMLKETWTKPVLRKRAERSEMWSDQYGKEEARCRLQWGQKRDGHVERSEWRRVVVEGACCFATKYLGADLSVDPYSTISHFSTHVTVKWDPTKRGLR